MAEERGQDKVEFLKVADPIHTGIAEADSLSFAGGCQGNLGREGQGNAKTTPANRLSHARMRFDPDDNPVVHKAEFGIFDVDGAGSLGISFQVITTFRAIEELELEGAFEGLAADLQLHGVALRKETNISRRTTSSGGQFIVIRV